MTKYDIFDWIKENCFHCMTVFSLFWNKLLGDISLFPEKLKSSLCSKWDRHRNISFLHKSSLQRVISLCTFIIPTSMICFSSSCKLYMLLLTYNFILFIFLFYLFLKIYVCSVSYRINMHCNLICDN